MPPNYDPVLEDLNRKVEDLTQELFVIKQKLNQLKFGTDLAILRNIGDRIQRLLNMFEYENDQEEDVDPGGSLERQDPVHVCTDEFHGTLAGYPLYKTGFRSQNCSKVINWSKLVTVVYNLMDEKDETVMKQIVNQTLVTYPGIRIRMASQANFETVETFNSFDNLGHLWNVLVQDIDTPYVFVGRDIRAFDENINFERMVSLGCVISHEMLR